MIEFFMPMIPPTSTHQLKQVNWKTKNFYEPERVKTARAKLMAHLGKHVPAEKMSGPLQLCVKWCFPVIRGKKSGAYKHTRPDTDNLNKLLKDCMTELGYWHDDAQVASEIIEKFWADPPGIYIFVQELEKEACIYLQDEVCVCADCENVSFLKRSEMKRSEKE